MSLVTCFSDVISYSVALSKTNFENQTLEGVQTKLDHYFEEIKKTTLLRYSDEEYQDSLFAICAWIDEIVLCSNWQERFKWKKQMLQQRYFNTTRAGEIFFEKLDTIETGEIDLIELYYYCLKFGFKGKYHKAQDYIIITEKCKSIYQLVMSRHGSDFDKPLVHCLLTPDGLVENSVISQVRDSKRNRRLKRWIVWLMPVIPFVVITLVFNEVIQSMALDYFKSF
ncbi:type IVB secretion system protein IcmH/DotU [Thiotrichales bacterium 19S3-7]|nr:type IVB secretion system protein IcmH/DotU [Thiotrichales bacterium 19S3-7]MCF6802138.1 type IVB secretion system protein IcmH/DotU [Thiotrichales bacterium 19S3-11]